MRRKTKLGLWLLPVSLATMLFSQAGGLAQDPPSSQPPANKTNPPAQSPPASDEQMIGNYLVNSTIELGGRGLSVSGNENQYKSNLNYHSGMRVFDSSFSLRDKDGHGLLFDELMVNGSGWGGDPQGYTRISVEKHGIYRFDSNIRDIKYFNNLSNFALGQHTYNTEMHFGNYNLTLLPENRKLKIYLGYANSSLNGPGVTTYDFSKDEFAINTNQQTRTNDYTVGADARLGPVDISFLQGFRTFKDDTTFSVPFPTQGNNTTNTSRIDTLFRSLPTRGDHVFTRFSAHTVFANKLHVTGRYVYTGSTTNFTFLEQLSGQLGSDPPNIINQETFRATGTVKRPYGIGEIGLTYNATEKLRLSNSFRIDQFHISGGDALSDFLQQSSVAGVPLPPTTTLSLFQRTTKYRRFMNLVEGDYQFNRNYSVHAGYRFTDRHTELFSLDAPSPGENEIFNNTTNSIIFGARARPVPVWKIYFDGERGTADSVFTRLENGKFTNFRIRSQVDLNQKLSFNASLIIRDNKNPSEVLLADTELPPGTAPNALDVSIKSRVFTSTVDWNPGSRLSLTGGYTHMHVTSDAGIILFIDKVSQFGQSQYFMRDNFFFFDAFVYPLPRVSLFATYRINRDPGQGNLTSQSLTTIIGSYPNTFQSPEARMTVKLTNRLDLNLGYQYYNYRDWFTPNQNYHAHLPYASLRVYFGGPREQRPQSH